MRINNRLGVWVSACVLTVASGGIACEGGEGDL
jgi:hypothetical protein